MTGLIAPDIRNLVPRGKGFILFQPEGGVKYHVGNVPSLVFTPTITQEDHFTAMEGIKLKDDTTVIEQGGTIKMQMEELTAQNLSLLVMGSVDSSDPNNVTVQIMDQSLIAGKLWFYATNAKGPRWRAVWNRVVFAPSGAFSPISDAQSSLEVTGTTEAVNGSFGTMTLKNAADAAAPENVWLPQVIGEAVEGVTLYSTKGGWIGGVTYAYQWNSNGTPIVGATDTTYVVQASDVGHAITLSITATNTIGTTTAVSSGTDPVTA